MFAAGATEGGVDEFVLILNPVGGAEEDGALVFFLADLHAVEADVVDDSAVRKAVDVEIDQSVVALAHGANPSLHRLAGDEGDFEGLGLVFDLAHDGFAAVVGLHDNDELRRGTERDFAEGSGVVRDAFALRCDLELAPIGILFWHRALHGVSR